MFYSSQANALIFQYHYTDVWGKCQCIWDNCKYCRCHISKHDICSLCFWKKYTHLISTIWHIYKKSQSPIVKLYIHHIFLSLNELIFITDLHVILPLFCHHISKEYFLKREFFNLCKKRINFILKSRNEVIIQIFSTFIGSKFLFVVTST